MLLSTLLIPIKGPYAQAVLRFQIAFPSNYPRSPPLITFQSEIFHPLVTPLTTYANPSGSRKLDSTKRNDSEQLSPGGLSLRRGFPGWFKGSEGSASSPPSYSEDGQQQGTESLSSEFSLIEGRRSTSPTTSDLGVERGAKPLQQRSPPNRRSSYSGILGVLQYVKAVLEDEEILDQLNLQDCANPGAWHAWQAHRRISIETSFPQDDRSDGTPTGEASAGWVGNSVATSQRPPSTWNWDGVWVDRVRKAVNTSISDSVLYNSGNGNEVIRFLDLDENTTEVIRRNVLKGKDN
ncbi:MAG: hypothetical protein Q9187_001156 [Circinaria calcarea]